MSQNVFVRGITSDEGLPGVMTGNGREDSAEPKPAAVKKHHERMCHVHKILGPSSLSLDMFFVTLLCCLVAAERHSQECELPQALVICKALRT